MKRFLLKLSIFFIIIAVFDFCIGLYADFLRDNAKAGITAVTNNILRRSTSDIMIYGSSRAIRHYAPEIISEVLTMECDNAGAPGYGIVHAYPLFKGMSKRFQPKVMVYEITPQYDYYTGDNSQFLGHMKTYIFQFGIEDYFTQINKSEVYKCLSAMYRYNGMLITLYAETTGKGETIKNGYMPMQGIITESARDKPIKTNKNMPVDEIKLYFLEQLCKDCIRSGIKLVFSHSPMYHGATRKGLEPAIQIAEKYNIPFMDYANDIRFVQQPEFFADRTHLNQTGAEEYSRIFAQDLKTLLEEKGVLKK